MLTESWEELSVETLLRAIENGYSEGKELEFKRQQNPDQDGHKQTTVGEVVSFANASGGDLVIGIADDEGVTSGLWPVQYDDVDDTILRWIDIIKRNTDPELPQHLVNIEALEITDEHGEYVDDNSPSQTGYVLVFRIQRSWRAPHRETVKNQFYERSSGGKTELDTGAIRQAMLQGELLTERAREFRDDRLAAIRADEVAVPLNSRPKLVLHVVPSNAFSVERLIDPSAASQTDQTVPSLLHPRGLDHGWERYTADGYLIARPDNDNRYRSYTLTFRSGVIEALTTRSSQTDPDYINSGHVRNCLEESLPTYKDFLADQGGTFPMYCFLSVIGGQGLPVAIQRTAHQEHDELEVIDRDVARLPAVQIESPQTDLDTIINELLDSLYNASGKAQEMRTEG